MAVPPSNIIPSKLIRLQQQDGESAVTDLLIILFRIVLATQPECLVLQEVEPTVTISTQAAFAAINSMFSGSLPHEQQAQREAREVLHATGQLPPRPHRHATRGLASHYPRSSQARLLIHSKHPAKSLSVWISLGSGSAHIHLSFCPCQPSPPPLPPPPLRHMPGPSICGQDHSATHNAGSSLGKASVRAGSCLHEVAWVQLCNARWYKAPQAGSSEETGIRGSGSLRYAGAPARQSSCLDCDASMVVRDRHAQHPVHMRDCPHAAI